MTLQIGTIGAAHAPIGPPGRAEQMRAGQDALAKKLGISTDDLQKAAQSGTSLADLAKQHGISRDDLKTFMVQQASAMGAPAGSTSAIDQIIDGAPPTTGQPRAQQPGIISRPANDVLAALRNSDATNTSNELDQLLTSLAKLDQTGRKTLGLEAYA